MSAWFSKSLVLGALGTLASSIAKAQRFDLRNGTAQLAPALKTTAQRAAIDRAVEYGRMRAFEDFARWVEDGALDRVHIPGD